MQFVLPDWTFFDSRGLKKESDVLSDESEKEEKLKNRDLYCLYCHHTITTKDKRISVHGFHIHQFTNPHGISFRIGCFKTADGGIRAGHPTDEWTWFQGYYWCITNCGKCFSHLGWHFDDNNGDEFFGLILCNLTE